MKYFFLISFIITFSQVYANSIETRIPLSQEGYLKLFQLLNFKEEKTKIRRDYYFDYFENENYALESNHPKLKLRIKRDRGKFKLQFKKTIDEGRFLCGKNLLYTSNKESMTRVLPGAKGKELITYFNQALGHLTQSDIRVNTLSEKIKNELQTTSPLLLHHLNRELNNVSKFFLTPTQYTRKSITNKIVVINQEKIKISLRVVEDFDSSNHVHLSYEIEISPKDQDNWQHTDFANFICEKLKLNRLKARDISPSRYLRKYDTLEQLRTLAPRLNYSPL